MMLVQKALVPPLDENAMVEQLVDKENLEEEQENQITQMLLKDHAAE
jgi:hypothetical protein